MTWHFSRALEIQFSRAMGEGSASSRFSRGLEAGSSAACSSAGARSPQWSLTSTVPASSWSARTKGTFRRFPFGTMCAPSTEARGEALLTWYQGASRARILVVRVKPYGVINHAASTGSAVDFGSSTLASSMKFVLDTRLLRTLRCSSSTGLTAFLEDWPKWGTMQSGAASPRPSWELHTSERESSFWHVTPTAQDYRDANDACLRSLDTFPGFLHKTRLWHQTPTAVLRSGVHYPLIRLDQKTRTHILTVYDNYSPRLKESSPGRFCTFPNPECSEAVMGWPISWTAVTPLATAKFRSWLRRHGVFSGPGSKKKSKKCPA
jgi:hypothetical protein